MPVWSLFRVVEEEKAGAVGDDWEELMAKELSSWTSSFLSWGNAGRLLKWWYN